MQNSFDEPTRVHPNVRACSLLACVRVRTDLRLANDALLATNQSLLAQLEAQRDVLEELQTFVVSVARALQTTRPSFAPDPRRSQCQRQLESLTDRQREVLSMVVAGASSKRIAASLGISRRTVENHRAAIMVKTGSASLPALTQMAVAAGFDAAVALVPPDAAQVASEWTTLTLVPNDVKHAS